MRRSGMRILVVNDDGIKAEGIKRLAEAAKSFGEVTVVAPEGQCSAMSSKITITETMDLKKADFPVPGVTAYSLSGTPADCVKVAVEYVLKEKPDYIFSGMNKGYNCGIETTYSGTVAAAMEGLLKGIPAIAFSVDYSEIYSPADRYIHEIIEKIFAEKPKTGEIWNVNFPACEAEDCRGIRWGMTLAKTQYFPDCYVIDHEVPGGVAIKLKNSAIEDAEEGSDLHALLNNYVSVGTIKNTVFGF